ncbi:NADH dehydrogenase [ubiquinone] complex I, assembly factor 7 [Hypsibius exemplaris]|uniref:Protein arginine methyltransferase NDUFAF7 n=1 Tax=Hypsibius exemplaris TaxID=2072580 RepID=A0A1W0WEM8_HYPEX|nr:NADH dehydrogenase [ubiquinone] complex I, assembly factor 7 [Hypsibius exemplaris]
MAIISASVFLSKNSYQLLYKIARTFTGCRIHSLSLGSPSLVVHRQSRSISSNTNAITKSEGKEAEIPQASEFLKYLRQRIKATGAITVAEYMQECLTNPYYGYYSRKNPFGRQGDFITSPEVCQIFGELVALWCVNEWNISNIGAVPFQIIELGPGTGTLAYDMLRILKSFPQIGNTVSLHLVERSSELARQQAKKLGIEAIDQTWLTGAGKGTVEGAVDGPVDGAGDVLHYQTGISQFGIPVYWYQRIQDIPKGAPAFIVANEFFDALPIHKLQMTDGKLREVLVDVTEDDSRLRFVIAPNETAAVRLVPKESRKRQHLELSVEAGVVLNDIADRVTDHGGGALIIDYGHDGTKTDTFRAFQHHKVLDPLHEPGQADVTADVDFSLLRQMLRPKAISYGPITQSTFLFNMAFEQRFNALMKACKSDEEQDRLAAACDVLINPAKMGGQFFVFAVFGWKRGRLGPVTGGFQ